MALRRDRDGASIHVLEAIVLSTVMLSSIAFVVTYEAPPTETHASREALGGRVRDVLAILNDTPVEGSDLGNNMLSVGLLECLQQDCDRLTTKLDQLMPVGTRYAVYLSTGDGLYPVYAPRAPGGEAVTQRRLIEPAWSYLFLATSQSMVNPLEDPLIVYGIPVVSASPVHQGGSALSIVASGSRPADSSAFLMRTSATTRAVTTDDAPDTAGVSMFFHSGDGAARGTRDVRAQSIDALGMPTRTPITFGLRIAESGGGSVPEGAIATIQFPHGWNASAPQALNDPDWLVLSNATDANGSARGASVSAKLRHAVSSGHVDLWFQGNYTGDVDDWYAFTASLTAGAYARASLLVRADAHAATSAFEVPALVASVPRPLGAGATTTWTLAAVAPDSTGITRIEIVEEEGRAIFDSVVGVSGGGVWSTTGDTLVWEGDADVAKDTPLDLVFEVTSSATRGPPTERAPFVPSVEVDDYSGALAHELAPGLHAGVFLPATASAKGYDTTITGVTTDHPLTSDSVYRSTPLPGSAEYTVGPALGLDDSLFGSSLMVERRYATPGMSVDFAVETQSVLYHLAVLGLEPTVEFNLYPPWTGDTRVPIVSETLYDASIAKGAGTFLGLIDTNGDLQPDETDVGRLSASVDIPTSWLYGSYIAEVKITWLEEVGGLEVTRIANLYDYFVLRPSTGDLPSSPVYDVHLVAWQEDWG